MQLTGVVEIQRERAAVRNLAAGYQVKGAKFMEEVEHSSAAARHLIYVGVESTIPLHDIAFIRVFVFINKPARTTHGLRCCQAAAGGFVEAVSGTLAPAILAAAFYERRVILVTDVFVNGANPGDGVAFEEVGFTSVLPYRQISACIAGIVFLS